LRARKLLDASARIAVLGGSEGGLHFSDKASRHLQWVPLWQLPLEGLELQNLTTERDLAVGIESDLAPFGKELDRSIWNKNCWRLLGSAEQRALEGLISGHCCLQLYAELLKLNVFGPLGLGGGGESNLPVHAGHAGGGPHSFLSDVISLKDQITTLTMRAA
jgi:hypothetical protein